MKILIKNTQKTFVNLKFEILVKKNKIPVASGIYNNPFLIIIDVSAFQPIRGDLNLNISRHECSWREIQIKLTVTEFLILENLVNRPGYVKSRDQLMSAAYDDNIYVDDRTIDSHIKRIRRKFKSKDKNFDSIETLYGVGYRFNQ